MLRISTITSGTSGILRCAEAAAKRRKTIGQLIEGRLEFYGIKTTRSAEELVAKGACAIVAERSRRLACRDCRTHAARRK